MTAWLNIVGIGEDGLSGIGSLARETINDAEVLFGGERHLALVGKKGLVWKTPLEDSFVELDQLQDKRVVVIATGDPMWFGIGATLGRRYGPDAIRIIPSASSFSLVAARLSWPLSEIDCLTVHGRDLDRVKAFFLPGNKIIVLTNDGKTPNQIAGLLKEAGFGGSLITVFSHIGGANEQSFESTAIDWDHKAVPDLNTMAIECLADAGLIPKARVPGLPDSVFESDGQLTKREVRAITISSLAPMPGQMLWDIGAGCGSISIEWLRGTRNARAIAVERNMDRLGMINRNALALGVPELKVIFGEALTEIVGLPSPDAVFIGGGVTTDGLLEYCWQNLRSGGRLVVNSVTFESERRLFDAHKKLGGELNKIGISRAQAAGDFTSWLPHKTVTQLKLIKK
jgi:precorrin-6Y C5,15-methyltransferase (decarboxylating)